MNERKPPYRRKVQIHFAADQGRMVLRTDEDWERELDPVEVSADGNTSTFVLGSALPYCYVKPGLRTADGALRLSIGRNVLVLMTPTWDADVYPYFDGSEQGSFSELVELDSEILGRKHLLRVYLPPGYHQCPLRKYSVLYMQDGNSLFFPEEAFQNKDWAVDDVLHLLDRMSVTERALVIGIHSSGRTTDYTKPGYEAYARAIVEEVRPFIAQQLRVLDSPRETGVIGSSLGGVVSFYMAWQYPHVFGWAACMSTAFGFQDDLIERVLTEPKCPAKFYLDSGWPNDNYEATLAMAMALSERGYVFREDFMHLAFPLEQHDERAWGSRLHLPLQLAMGRPAVARRRSDRDGQGAADHAV